jgi:hypothetical protein
VRPTEGQNRRHAEAVVNTFVVLALTLLVCWGLTGLIATGRGGWREAKEALLDSGVWIGANLILGAVVVGITLIVWKAVH